MAKATDPIVIGKRTAKNRVTMAPTVKFIAGEDGRVTEDFVAHYAERAKHQCAFICVEATCVAKEARLAPSQLGLWEDGQIEGHRKLTDACHEYDTLVVPQLHYGGLGTHPACGPLVGPSKMVREAFGQKSEVKELSRRTSGASWGSLPLRRCGPGRRATTGCSSTPATATSSTTSPPG
ncbi:MAG: hypothetical protein IKO91_00775 [Oscillospiraceae bacterium]|nr:hypothetical protein [Oscillospiraceae bacterium]